MGPLSLLSVLLRTRSMQRLCSQHFAAVPMPNIAELVPSGFFCPQPLFLRQSEHIFPGKTPAVSCRHLDRHLVTGNEMSSKLTSTLVSAFVT